MSENVEETQDLEGLEGERDESYHSFCYSCHTGGNRHTNDCELNEANWSADDGLKAYERN